MPICETLPNFALICVLSLILILFRVFFCSERTSGVVVGDVSSTALSRQCGADDSVVLAAVSFHQHVDFQPHRTRAAAAPLHSRLGPGASASPASGRDLGRATGAGTRCRVSPGQSASGAFVILLRVPLYPLPLKLNVIFKL